MGGGVRGASCVSQRARSEGEPRHGAFGGCMQGQGSHKWKRYSEGEKIWKPQKLWKLLKRSGKGLMRIGCISVGSSQMEGLMDWSQLESLLDGLVSDGRLDGMNWSQMEGLIDRLESYVRFHGWIRVRLMVS